MAEAAAKTTTRPRTRKATPAKSAPVKAAPAEESKTGAVTDGDTTRVTFEMTDAGETKSYHKFSPPADSGVVGTLYFPLGTTGAKVLFYGPADE